MDISILIPGLIALVAQVSGLYKKRAGGLLAACIFWWVFSWALIEPDSRFVSDLATLPRLEVITICMLNFALLVTSAVASQTAEETAAQRELRVFEAARAFVLECLADGPVPARVLLERGAARGFTVLTCYEALAQLDAEYLRHLDAWRLDR